MKNITGFIVAFLFFLSGLVFSQSKTGKSLIDYENLSYLQPEINEIGGVNVERIKGEANLLQFKTLEQPRFIYSLSTNFPLASEKRYEKGDVFLVSFEARTISSEIETGEGRAHWILRQSDSYKDNLPYTLGFTGDWKKYYIPFKLTKNVKRKELQLTIQYGYRPQVFQIRNLKFEFYPDTKFEELPKTKITYSGMEPDAEWRKKAIDRVEKNRKGDFSLVFMHNGKRLTSEKIKIEQLSHEFLWGAAVSDEDILNKGEYLHKFRQHFNKAVFENDLKIKHWQGTNSKEKTLQAIKKLNGLDISVKGHVLVWPGFRHLTPEFRKNSDDPAKIKRLVHDHVREIVSATKGYIDNWDVVNEVYTNKDLQEITGSEKLLYEAFILVHNLDPKPALFTNEYGIISKGGLDSKKQQWYKDFIQRIDENTSGLVDGIGIQSHMGSDLTPPEKVLELLDFYAELDKKISISEFTMEINDPAVREQYTKDFLLAAFSHPAVSEFLFWGFYEPDNKKVDFYKKNWQLGSMGKAFTEMVEKRWHSSFKANLENGKFEERAFYGDYSYTVQMEGREVTGTFTLKKGKNNQFKIEL